MRDHLLDRFAICLSANQILELQQRVEITQSALAQAESSETFRAKWQEDTDALATKLLLARQWLPDVQISREQIGYLVQEALRGWVEGHRSELYAVRVARAHAALSGRDQVEADDLQVAVRLVIAPRALQMPPQDPNQQMEPPPPPPPPQGEQPEDQNQDDEPDNDDPEDDDPEDDSDENQEDETPRGSGAPFDSGRVFVGSGSHGHRSGSVAVLCCQVQIRRQR